ncbi:MAG: ATP-binding cassette domain-containing protein [Bacteroidales bacterium]|nr:ATP-binding cassette domain-containing protein [Bacteroidales bacterium]
METSTTQNVNDNGSAEAVKPKNIISLRGVSICHESGPILTNVSFDMAEGEFAYLIGKSGAGKTSLMRSLYANQYIGEGEAEVCGYDLCHIRRRHIPMLRRKIGIVFQNFRLLDDRNVYDNLFFVLRATGWKNRTEIDNQIMRTLTAVGIADKATCATYQLSEGEQQRVGIARAIINSPSLILADEPTGNLDPITSGEIMTLLTQINQQQHVTMLISTHDFMMIDKFPSRVLCCENGTVVDTE